LAVRRSDSHHPASRAHLALNRTVDSVMQHSVEVSYAEVAVADHGVSALSWAAIIGGALAAAAVTLIMLGLGAGFGFVSVSPWPSSGATAATFGVTAAIWLIVVQWLSSAFGGYLAGRTRARWNGMHTDESVFRDTAHGVLSWALATVIAAGLLSAAAAAFVGGTFHAATAIGAAGAQGMSQVGGPDGDPMAYFVDSLFRADPPAITPQDVHAESGRILLREMRDGSLSDPDKAYLAQLVSKTTNLSQADAAKRVDEISNQVSKTEMKLREDSDAARRVAAHASFFTAFSMLIGAFIAGAAGALGGVHREHHAFLMRRGEV
jgi:hypothetical protein